ncbi:hypothetical protein [Natribacillus halophilus]|uniref:Uncharacterized protein n=1 Tax=Natribacillus halophilus TaxID=549003 RepID=A0A1G8LQB5_9BACI|nr:hypothetical protein [Natribacillus halophilus]SDI57856.1 hypothetical protein SAMN04488123_103215 [Natribacillus halophilus]
MIKTVWHGLLLLTVLLPLASCFNASEEVDNDIDAGDEATEEGSAQEEENSEEEGTPSLETFVYNYFTAVNSGDEEEVALVTNFETEEGQGATEAIVEEFEQFSMNDLNIQVLEEEQASRVDFFYDYYPEEDSIEAVSVLIEGEFGGDDAELYGDETMVIRNDLLIHEQAEDWEVIGNFAHTPLPAEQSAATQGGLLYTPEAFVAEYYQRLENEEYDQLYEFFSEDYRDERQMDDDEYVEELSEGEIEPRDTQVIMGELFAEDVQEVIPELFAYTTENDDYIVRAQYQTDSDEHLFTEDVLVSEIEDEWRISMIHRYE